MYRLHWTPFDTPLLLHLPEGYTCAMQNHASQIPLFSAAAANEGVDLDAAVKRVLATHWFVLGQEVQSFEQEFADYVGSRYCTSMATGTDALELALRAAGVGPGDQVVTVANAGFYSSTAILSIGASPIYVDVEPTTMTMSVEGLREALSRKPKAIVVTHLYGRLADIHSLCELAEEAGIALIEDCAQAHGASIDGRRAGSFGAMGCFSFYPTKNLGAIGDGGAVTTNDPELDVRLRQLRQYGWSTKYHVAIPGGTNSRLDELQAAVLREKLPRLDGWNEERRSIAQRYNEAFALLPVMCPDTTGKDFVGHLYVLRSERRDALRRYLAERGIGTDVHYPVPDHLQSVMASSRSLTLPVTERLCREVLSLPCFPGMAEDSVSRVIGSVTNFFNGH